MDITINPKNLNGANIMKIINDAKSSKRRLSLTPLNNMKAREFLLERFNFEKGSLVNICGTGASGKTLFVQYLALCIAQKKPLFNQFKIEGRTNKVLHIDLEQTEALTSRRYVRLANGLGIDINMINNIDRDKLDFKLDDPSKSHQEMIDFLVESWKGYDAIIIDSLRQAIIQDENNSQIAQPLSVLKRVAEINNCVIIFIHHKGKGGVGSKQSGRGSSAIYDGIDIQIDLDSDNAGTISLSCAKNRDGIYFQGMSYTLEDKGDFDENQRCTEQLALSLLEDKLKVNESDRQEVIVRAIKLNGTQKQNDLFTLVKGNKAAFDKLIVAMIQQQIIKEEKGPKNSRVFSAGVNIDYV